MRKWLKICVPMILLLLTACGSTTAGNDADELALAVRSEYLAMQTWRAQCEVTADYGQRVYDFTLAVHAQEDATQIELTAPRELAGITVTLSGTDSAMELDGTVLETGDLGGECTPVTAAVFFVETIRSGFMDVCTLETDEDGVSLLRIACRNPEGTVGEGEEVTLWVDAETHALLCGETAIDGKQVLICRFSDFSGQIQN